MHSIKLGATFFITFIVGHSLANSGLAREGGRQSGRLPPPDGQRPVYENGDEQNRPQLERPGGEGKKPQIEGGVNKTPPPDGTKLGEPIHGKERPQRERPDSLEGEERPHIEGRINRTPPPDDTRPKGPPYGGERPREKPDTSERKGKPNIEGRINRTLPPGFTKPSRLPHGPRQDSGS